MLPAHIEDCRTDAQRARWYRLAFALHASRGEHGLAAVARDAAEAYEAADNATRCDAAIHARRDAGARRCARRAVRGTRYCAQHTR